jgi:hypothetical protein
MTWTEISTLVSDIIEKNRELLAILTIRALYPGLERPGPVIHLYCTVW